MLESNKKGIFAKCENAVLIIHDKTDAKKPEGSAKCSQVLFQTCNVSA